jgi:hypothetical protein
MGSFRIDTFEKLVTDWANARNDDFKYYWPVKGGWEGWAQVDIVAFAFRKDTTYDIKREQSIYTDAEKRVDLLLNANEGVDLQIPVELKCESFENKGTPFVNSVVKDVNKLGGERKHEFAKCSCVDIAVPFSNPSRTQILAIHVDNKPIFKELAAGEVSVCAAVWKSPGGWVTTGAESEFESPVEEQRVG